MHADLPYRQLADFVLVLHAAIVAYVVTCPFLIVIGNLRGWRWVDGIGLRLCHAAAMLIVVAQAWLGLACPLTRLEAWLRVQAREPIYDTGFVAHWLWHLLYWDAPAWVFVAAYTIFGALVAAVWWRYPPARRTPARIAA
jgi:hypothetical protein